MSFPTLPAWRRFHVWLDRVLLDRRVQAGLFLGALLFFWLAQTGVAWAR